MSTPTDPTTDYWLYTTRCERCENFIDYCVKKDMPYDTFRRVTLSMPLQSFKPCEGCERQTLQTLVAYESQPEAEA